MGSQDLPSRNDRLMFGKDKTRLGLHAVDRDVLGQVKDSSFTTSYSDEEDGVIDNVILI